MILKQNYDGLKWRAKLWRHENWLLGWIFELRGNQYVLDRMSFRVDSSIRTASKAQFLCGLYEKAELELVRFYLPSENPVIELGACLGVVSCITNQRLQTPESHVVVEANPHLIDTLQANRERNACHFDIRHAAVGYGQKEIAFPVSSSFLGSSVYRHADQVVVVPTTSVEEIVRQNGFEVISLICDIEGSEVDVVANEIETLTTHVGLMIVETHPHITGTEAIEEMLILLQRSGFEIVDRRGITLCLQNQKVAKKLHNPKTPKRPPQPLE